MTWQSLTTPPANPCRTARARTNRQADKARSTGYPIQADWYGRLGGRGL